MSGTIVPTPTSRHLADTDLMSSEEPDYDGFDTVLAFLGFLVAGIVVFVGLLYGFFWLMFDAGN